MRKTARGKSGKPVHAPKGEGEGQSAQTRIKLLRPEDVWQPAIGAPRGNRNAARPLSTLEARVRDLKRRVRQALRRVKAQC